MMAHSILTAVCVLCILIELYGISLDLSYAHNSGILEAGYFFKNAYQITRWLSSIMLITGLLLSTLKRKAGIIIVFLVALATLIMITPVGLTVPNEEIYLAGFLVYLICVLWSWRSRIIFWDNNRAQRS